MKSKYFKDDTQNYYICENILDYDGQMAILRMKEPLVFVHFNYADSYFSTFEDWRKEIVRVEWLSGTAPDAFTQQQVLTDCWNFLALHEREEENRYERGDYDEEDDY